MLGLELERAIRKAWLKLRGKILSDPQELHRRLARRRMKTLTRPPRAWCIAIRASDRRITPAHWVISPEHAMDLNHPAHPYEPIEHEVTIQTHAIRRYCHPVRIGGAGDDVEQVAKILGVTPASLWHARKHGFFEERFLSMFRGKRGRPIPFINKSGLLDPGSANFHRPPHEIWGSNWEWLPTMFPEDFEQTVIRRPFYKKPASGADTLVRHPQKGFLRHPDDPPQLLGYRWLCPSCKKEVRTIYYPVPVRAIFDSGTGIPLLHSFTDPVIQKKLCDADLPQPPPPLFACRACHNIKFHSTIDAGFWNQLIACLTAGLLFGREVPKPPSFQPQRKNTRTRRLGYSAPIRRKVLTRLRLGLSPFKIAQDLRTTIGAVRRHIYLICREENVPNVHALAKKLNFPVSPPLNQIERAAARRAQVQQMLLQNCTQEQICQKLNIDRGVLCSDTKKIYRAHGIKAFGYRARRALAAKLGLPFLTEWDDLREKVATLRAQKQTCAQIAAELNVSTKTVSYLCSKRGQSAHQVRSVGPPPKESPPMAMVGPAETKPV